MTAARRRVYDALRELTADGWPASVRDVQRKVGLASSQSPHEHLKALEREGLAELHPRNPRLGWKAKA